jgi:hypothetical protein
MYKSCYAFSFDPDRFKNFRGKKDKFVESGSPDVKNV